MQIGRLALLCVPLLACALAGCGHAHGQSLGAARLVSSTC
jgi:hypothetical protein